MTVVSLFDDLEPGSSNVDVADAATLHEEAKSHLGVIEWVAPASSVVPEVAKLLDVPLPTVFVRFWETLDEISAALDDSRRSPGTRIEVSLFDSKTEASFFPHIEVRLNGIAPGKKVPVTVTLPLTFSGVVLVVRDGAIVDAVAGRCDVGGKVVFGKVTLARLRKAKTIDLARVFRDAR